MSDDKVTTRDMHEVELKRGDYVQIENQGSFEYGQKAIVLEIRGEDSIAVSVENEQPCTVMLESSFLVQKLKEPVGRLRDDEREHLATRVQELEDVAKDGLALYVNWQAGAEIDVLDWMALENSLKKARMLEDG
jgi:hypothetical protein